MKVKRINFEKSVQMHNACASDELRPAMEHIYFNNGFAYASDGVVLVKNKIEECSTIPVEQIDLLNNKFLHKDAYKAILKYDTIEISEDGIECKKGSEKAFYYFNNDETLKYPNCEELLKRVFNMPNINTTQIGFNLSKIDGIEKSLFDSGQCEFRFKNVDTNPYVLLESRNSNSSVGLLMPLMSLDTI